MQRIYKRNKQKINDCGVASNKMVGLVLDEKKEVESVFSDES